MTNGVALFLPLFSHRHHPLRLPSDRFSGIFWKFSRRKFFTLSLRCHPLDGVTRGGPPLPSDATVNIGQRRARIGRYCHGPRPELRTCIIPTSPTIGDRGIAFYGWSTCRPSVTRRFPHDVMSRIYSGWLLFGGTYHKYLSCEWGLL